MRKSVIFSVAGLLVLLFGAAFGRIFHADPVEDNLKNAEVPRKWWDDLAIIKLLAGAALLIGLVWPPLLMLTAVLLVFYFGGAVVQHIRAGDWKFAPAASGMVLAAVLTGLLTKGPTRALPASKTLHDSATDV